MWWWCTTPGKHNTGSSLLTTNDCVRVHVVEDHGHGFLHLFCYKDFIVNNVFHYVYSENLKIRNCIKKFILKLLGDTIYNTSL